MLNHSNLSYYVPAMARALGITSDDIYLHTATFTFSSSVRQLMVPLARGATVAIAAADDIRNPLNLFEAIKRRAVTIFDTVPSYWRSCIQALSSLDLTARASLLDNSLRRIVVTGEPLPPDLPASWREHSRKGQMINMYGQTETTGTVATYVSPAGNLGMGTVPIGKPITNVDMYLMDDRQELVPVGEPGEIYVGGPTSGRGYLNRPELTAERFVPDPFADSGARLYKTGDRARYRADGTLEFLGRLDDQIKIRGIRIEPGEIEAALSQHSAIEESAVVAGENGFNEKRLVAYLTPKGNRPPTASELRSFLNNKLPEYMVPSTFVTLHSLPRTHSGKLDRRALPGADFKKRAIEKPYITPRNPIEEALALVWAEVLGIDKVSVDDDFFDLGGHSLAVTQVISRLQERFQAEFSVRSVLEAPAFADVAALISQTQAKRFKPDDVNRILSDLESMSDDEAQYLVARSETQTAKN